MKGSIRDHLAIAEAVDQSPAQVTKWESDFIESILQQLDDGRDLTAKQVAVLQKMEKEYLT